MHETIYTGEMLGDGNFLFSNFSVPLSLRCAEPRCFEPEPS